ncbi:citrate lyase subunit alpha [Anaerosinus massiliensis]|uniref:citrate lyase subunit alpha n=1 Tax=Massilibacillus massiliensis TaxID=1806837 RepID=UPI000A4389FF|nr:citrate lyase subunit alpha [Massilibacillus massiliensis]
MKNAINHEISAELLQHLDLEFYHAEGEHKDYATLNERLAKNGKLLSSLEEAIHKSGLKDGMTISFHHHFRNGDYILNMVMHKLSEMGFKNLTVASSSLSTAHAPLIEHIKSGVVRKIETSGMRGDLADAISHGLMKEPVIFRSHGGRASAIANGSLHIDVAFLGAPSSDVFGNASGIYTNEEGKSICGSLGYAKVDARYADTTIILTDNLVPFPNAPASIPATDVDYVIQVEALGDSSKISSGATRFTKNPRDLLIAEAAAKVIQASGYFKDGFSIQTGSGGAALAVTRFISEEMIKRDMKARFALGGITAQIVKLHEEGLIGKILDVQGFDTSAAESLIHNLNHIEVDGNQYASPFNEGSAIHQLDIVILSALEVDVNFNVNVLTGSDGVIRGAIGGHPDTASKAALTVLVSPVIRGRIPCILDKVNTLVTPGAVCDVLVTDQGIAVNPNRPEVKERLMKAGLKVTTIEALKDSAEKVVGTPDALQFTDKVVGVVTHPDGRVLDVIHEVKA